VVEDDKRMAPLLRQGSGEVIRADGDIVTNNHVLASAATGGSITVVFDNGTSVAARLVGRDPLSDVAVMKVDTSWALPPIPFGDSATLRIGEPVVVLGAPLGLSSTVTAGIVSALGRTITVPGEGSVNAVLLDAIQTDAAINPGNSGGALVNCSGRLVGIRSAGATVPSASGQPSPGGDIGLGFGIPVDVAESVANEFIATGKVPHAYLGLDAEPLSSGTGEGALAPGCYVTAVSPGRPAASAGIRAGGRGDDDRGEDGRQPRPDRRAQPSRQAGRQGDPRHRPCRPTGQGNGRARRLAVAADRRRIPRGRTAAGMVRGCRVLGPAGRTP
jgi:putative serine protease PepD